MKTQLKKFGLLATALIKIVSCSKNDEPPTEMAVKVPTTP